MSAQTTSRIIMVRPAAFGYNVETAANNTFQHIPETGQEEVKARALEEFDRLAALLEKEGVEVTVIQDTSVPVKPDAIFPNNWISFHQEDTIVTYPMFARLRRMERREEIIDELSGRYNIRQRLEMEQNEKYNQFLEGTGSMVLDRVNRVAYACISPRTDTSVLDRWCSMMDYKPFTFIARYDGQDIYHTNVMMAIGDGVSVACFDVVDPPSRRDEFRAHLASFGREVVALRPEQIGSFAGNMLAIRNSSGEQLMVMSRSAHLSLDESQVAAISRHARIVSSDVSTIETIGGGSVRCMIAENFLSPI
ncbi:MAG: amidinotransferase [Saprospiraceae bacterium]|nr:amidinotransferase [Candidatus Opimibacter iunctus]